MFVRSVSVSVSVAVLVLVSWSAVPVSSAGAQMASLIPGVRARIRAPGSINGRLTGTVLDRTTDSLSIATESGVPVRLPLSRLTSVEISRGKSRSRGAMKGAVWGAPFGLLSGLFSDTGEKDCSKYSCNRGATVAAGVGAGVFLGAVIGAAIQSERWERLTVPVRVALVRTRHGPTAVVAIRF